MLVLLVAVPRGWVCATGAGAHQGQTSREGEKDIWWTAGTARGGTAAKTVKRPRQQPAQQQQPQYANYWAPVTRKRHTMPHSAQPQHTNYWAPQTRKRHQQEHRPQRPTESSNPTQHAKGRTGDCPGPRKGATTRPNVTQGDMSLIGGGYVFDWHLLGGLHVLAQQSPVGPKWPDGGGGPRPL